LFKIRTKQLEIIFYLETNTWPIIFS